MKNAIILVSTLFSLSSFANVINVKCQAPDDLGNSSIITLNSTTGQVLKIQESSNETNFKIGSMANACGTTGTMTYVEGYKGVLLSPDLSTLSSGKFKLNLTVITNKGNCFGENYWICSL